MGVLLLSAYWQCRWSHSGRRSQGSAIFPAEEPRLDFSEHKWCYAPIIFMAFIVLAMPKMLITRFKLYART